MGVIKNFWDKICAPLDGFLWHRNIDHPVIRPLLRNEIIAGGACILAGAILFVVFPWLFWFGCGLCCMVWIFWSWAKFFLNLDPDDYRSVFVKAFFINFGLRFVIFAILLYIAFAIFNASVSGLLAGMIAGCILAIVTYAFRLRSGF